MAERPTGAVTFLFTDIEGSTQAWENDPTTMAADLEVHDRVLREAIELNGGFVFATGGDSFSAAFSSPTSALTAAADAQRGLTRSECGLRVRMGVHSGEAVERDGNYFGPALNRTARLMSIGHGGQILVSTATRELVTNGGFEFIDLGEHRLADLSTPTWIAQLVADGLERDFPSLRSVVATDNLPRLGAVFGRDSDIEKLTERLHEHRLVTLTGAGGIGKTTLATSVAARMVDPFPDGRWLVDLTGLPPGSERTAIAGAVAGVDDRFGSVKALGPRQMLLVLDNTEHVLDGVRSYLSDLLDTAPQVTVLATSREPIGILGERVLPVAPLSVDEDSTHASAVDLFVTRATEAGVTLDLDADRHTITAICRQVGGLPLAIELAAARTAVMTPTQILDRLSDRLSLLRGGVDGPEHHRTIEATIAWSHDLLNEDTQKLLRFLSVFEGGFDLEQVEAVGGDGAVDRLTNLVRKSLVTREDERFGMLEAVRQYANARLREMGEEDDARRLHFEFFADWAHRLYSRGDFIRMAVDELKWMTLNLANARLAVRWGIDADVERSAEISALLWKHWIDVLYFRWDDSNVWEPLLARLDDLDPQLQLVVLHAVGTIAWQRGDLDRASELLEGEYAIHRASGHLPRTGVTPQANLAGLRIQLGDIESGLRLSAEGIEVARKEERPHHAISGNYARNAWQYGDGLEEALHILDRARELDHLATPLELADFALDEAEIVMESGDHDTARRLIEQALAYFRIHDVRLDQRAWAVELLADIEHRQGDQALASALLLEVIELESTYGLTPTWHKGATTLARVLLAISQPRAALRVVDEFRNSSRPGVYPIHIRRLAKVETAAQTQLSAVGTGQDGRPLIDAVREALETAAR